MANSRFPDIVTSVPAKAVTTDPVSLYPARSQVRVRIQLIDAIQHREDLVVLTGESGTGKTTVCRSVLRSLDPSTFVAQVVNSSVTLDDLLKQILSDFGAAALHIPVNVTSSHDLMLAVGRFLDLMPPAARAILVIDEAHDVRAEVLAQLRTLANLQRPDGRTLQIILIGQPALDAMLGRDELLPIRQRLTRRCHIEPLEHDEIEPYIIHRFQGGNMPAFLPSAIKTVAALSRGVPRTVNLLADRASEIALERQMQAVGRDVIVESASRLALAVPLGQRPIVRRLAFIAAVAFASTLSAGLLVFRVIPYARTRFTATPPVASQIRGQGSGVRDQGPSPSPAPTASGEAANAPVAPAPNTSTARATPLEIADSYLVLAGSFKSARNADATVERLSKLRLPAFARQDGEWNVVLIGPYVTPEEARQARAQIGNDFPDAYVLRLQVPEPAK